MLNRVVLIGRLTRDPELRVTTSGKNVCDFSIAVQKRTRSQDGSPDADFFKIIAWERTAEYASNYLTKGRLIAVDGRLQSRKYTTQEGASRESIEIIADNLQSLDRPRENADAEPVGTSAATKGSGSKVDEYDPFADE